MFPSLSVHPAVLPLGFHLRGFVRAAVATMTLVAKGRRRGKVTMAPQRPSYLGGKPPRL